MGDGTTKPLADVGVGDAIYGTVRDGYYRRYAITEVLAHWSTVKPAYRITLEDGTKLVASGDHRFLTERGWKHVTGAEQGPDQRPFLTAEQQAHGLRRGFAEPPKDSVEYRRGYLCGMIRGDANLGQLQHRRSATGLHRSASRWRTPKRLTRTRALPRAPSGFSPASSTSAPQRADAQSRCGPSGPGHAETCWPSSI